MATRRSFTKGLLAAGLANAMPRYAFAADWPKRPVKLIVPFAPGGNTDGIARLISHYLGDRLGQPFVIENKPGAGGAIAAELLARSDPDGYTLMMVTMAQLGVLPVLEATNYDPLKDFAPVSNIASNPMCLVTNPLFAPKSIPDFVTYVKARPGELSYASGGRGSLGHLTMLLFLQRAGLDMVNVPYKGGGPAIADVIGNQVPVYFANISEILPHASGVLNRLAVSGIKRSAQLPDVPTIAESGYANFRTETWNGLAAPAKTPQPVIDLLAACVRDAVKDAVIRQRFDSYGVEPIGSSPKEFGETIAADIAQWATALNIAGMKRL